MTVLSLAPTLDGYVFQFNGEGGSGGSPYTDGAMSCGIYFDGTNFMVFRDLLQFSLSSVPAAATISSAILTLTGFPSGDAGTGSHSFTATRATTSWSSSTVWDTQPTIAGSPDATTSVSIPLSTGTTLSFNITALVQGWYAGTISNYGLMVKAASESLPNHLPSFATNEFATTGSRPVLAITYSTVPSAPTLISPANNAPAPLNTTSFQWSFVDADAGDSQSAYALRRRAFGSVTYQWWTGSTWTTTETFITSSSASVTPTGFTNTDDTYFWSVATKDSAGLPSSYSAERTVNPWEWWNGTNWVYSVEAFITSSIPSTTIAAAQFASGDYKWSVATKDNTTLVSPYSDDTRFTYGGSGQVERFGNFI